MELSELFLMEPFSENPSFVKISQDWSQVGNYPSLLEDTHMVTNINVKIWKLMDQVNSNSPLHQKMENLKLEMYSISKVKVVLV